jgi:hypothetical protein
MPEETIFLTGIKQGAACVPQTEEGKERGKEGEVGCVVQREKKSKGQKLQKQMLVVGWSRG